MYSLSVPAQRSSGWRAIMLDVVYLALLTFLDLQPCTLQYTYWCCCSSLASSLSMLVIFSPASPVSLRKIAI